MKGSGKTAMMQLYGFNRRSTPGSSPLGVRAQGGPNHYLLLDGVSPRRQAHRSEYDNSAASGPGNPTRTKRLRDFAGATLGTFASGVGPSFEYGFDANQINVTSLTRRGDQDGTPASLETDNYTDFQYDVLGRIKRGPDAAWYAAEYDYDALDRPIKTPDGRGNTWANQYDANGNALFAGLTVNGAYLDGHYATYDQVDRIERYVDYAGNASLTGYKALGQVTSVTEADGYTLGFDRDPVGRVLGACNQQGQRVSFSLDAEGKPRTVTDPNNLTTAYQYHGASQDGLLQRTTLPTGSGQSAGRAVEVATHDGAGRPTRINTLGADGSVRDTYRFHDELGRLTRQVGPQVNPPSDTTRPVSCCVYSVLSDVRKSKARGCPSHKSQTCT